MQQYKPREDPPVEADRLTVENVDSIIEWAASMDVEAIPMYVANVLRVINLITPVGVRRLRVGDYLVRQANGDLVVMSAAGFEAAYEVLPAPSTEPTA